VTDDAFTRVVEGRELRDRDIRAVLETGPDEVGRLAGQAAEIKQRRFGNRLQLCAIINAKSGRCSEDCSFCAQSGHYATEAPVHGFVGPERIGLAAGRAVAGGVARFGIVTSGKMPDRREVAEMAKGIEAVRRAGAVADVSPGILPPEDIALLKAAGLAGYHHNLETSRRFFPEVCSTHGYEEDVQAVRDAVASGLHVCSGGIFGIGETWEDRVELALTLKELGVHSVPVNFLQPIPGTPCGGRPLLEPWEALKIVALLRFLLPDRHIRICGGREAVFGRDKRLLLASGASGLMVGDYLTTRGASLDSDLAELAGAGLVLDRTSGE
jgi:biotin synthase